MMNKYHVTLWNTVPALMQMLVDGQWSRDFCLLEAGYMSQLLMETSPTYMIGLCPIGSLDFDSYRKLFKLDDSHIMLHSFLGGKIDKSQTTRWLLSSHQQTSISDLLYHYLEQKLPTYMVPEVYVPIDALPLTPTGKIDRNRLPKHEISKTEYTPPRSPVEEIIAKTWYKVIKTERIGIYDNFFKLGGNSLLTVQVVNNLQNLFKLQLQVRDIFKEPTVAGIAKTLVKLEPKEGYIETIATLRKEVAQMSKDDVEVALNK